MTPARTIGRRSRKRNGVLGHTDIEQMVLNSVVRYVNIFMHGWHTLTMWYVTEVCSVWHENRVKCSGIYTLVDLNCSVPAMCLQQPSAAPWNVWIFPQLDNCASHLNHLHRLSHHYSLRPSLTYSIEFRFLYSYINLKLLYNLYYF